MTLNQHKIETNVIIASLKSKSVGKLIKRIPGLHLLISSLPGSALRTHVESLGKPHDVNKHSQNLDIKRHSPSIHKKFAYLDLCISSADIIYSSDSYEGKIARNHIAGARAAELFLTTDHVVDYMVIDDEYLFYTLVGDM